MEKPEKRKKTTQEAAQQFWIKELSDKQIGRRVRVLGSILDIKSVQDYQTYIVMDDGTGHIQVIINKDLEFKLGAQIRIFGKIAKTEQNDLVIEAEIVQDMKELDIGLYKRVLEAKSNFEQKFLDI